MAKPLIPLRPTGFVTTLTAQEQSALTWYVLSGCSRRDAFLTFARPDFLISKASTASVEEYIKQFFARKEVKEYVDAYTNTINEVLHPEPIKKDAQEGTMEQRKARAKSQILEFAMDLVDNIDQASDKEMVLKIADKAGLLDQEEVVEELPRRYLPVVCSDCAYRQFCEENTEDMCNFCKYHQYGEENGIHFDKENMLNLEEYVRT